MAESVPACGKTPSAQTHRRTAVRASEKVTVALSAQLTEPTRLAAGRAWNRAATTVYRPTR